MADLDRQEGWFGHRLSNEFHFDEPWDSPNNCKLHQLSMNHVLQCPSDPAHLVSLDTNYVAVVGPGTIFPSDGTVRRSSDVVDGPGNTLMVVEVVGAGIHWMEPKELDWDTMSFRLNDPTNPSISSNHPFANSLYGGPHAVMVDDMIRLLPADITPDSIKALLSIAGGERIETPWT
jgi:hypothetical protein